MTQRGTALITGGTRGIGLGIARALAGDAWTLILCGIRQDREVAPAIDDLRRALDLDPHLYDALYNLAMALDAAGRRDEARPIIERFIREAPPQRYAADITRVKMLLDHR